MKRVLTFSLIIYLLAAGTTLGAATGTNTGFRYMRASSDTIPAGDAQPCPGTPTVTDIDGNVYNTVKIGEQCWMKENLRVTRYADNTEVTGRYVPNNDEANVTAYGYLYNWYAMMHGVSSSSSNPSGVQGICPTGWHVPSDAEWIQLTDYVSSVPVYWCGGNSDNIAKALAATTGWMDYSGDCAVGNNQSANNATGFGALPAGASTNSYGPFGSNAFFWSTTAATLGDGAYNCFLRNYFSTVSRNTDYSKNNSFSVRCLLDPPCSPSSSEFSDTICDGNDGYSWNDSVYTESGDYTQTFTNAAGCDSVVTLHLTVTGCTPSCDAFTVRILGDTAGCATDSVTLHAMVPGSVPPVAVGDILCTDNTIVKPSSYAASGKTAMGVVFHVDGTGLHGWAIHLNDQSTSISWGGYGTDIPTLPNYSSPREALADTAGHANTAAIRAYGDAAAYPAAWAVDLDNGWYLPAAGQLRTLYGELPTLNASLQTAGGTSFPMSGYWWYWSSTECNSAYAWDLINNEDLNYFYKDTNDRVRSVRAF